MIGANKCIQRAAVKQSISSLILPQNLGFGLWLHAAAIKGKNRLTVKQKPLLFV
jgi:hypothetical protein